MSLFIVDRQQLKAPDIDRIKALLAPVIKELEIGPLDLEIELLDDSQIAGLNEKFFSRARPTNVISFPLAEDRGHLGSIVVSVETAERETAGLGYTLEEAIVYYLIHGLLHILGFEHVDVEAAEAAVMEKRQDELFELALRIS